MWRRRRLRLDLVHFLMSRSRCGRSGIGCGTQQIVDAVATTSTCGGHGLRRVRLAGRLAAMPMR